LHYSLYEICTKPDRVEERFLCENERIVDVIAVWDKEKADFEKKKEAIEFKLYLKLQTFYKYAETDIDTITMVYMQTVYDVLSGRLNLSEEKIVDLAALELLANFGQNKDLAFKAIQENLEKYLPRNHIDDLAAITWSQKIMDTFVNLNQMSKLAAKITYLEYLKSNPLYQSHQFTVKYSEKLNANNAEKSYPEDCVLAIKSNGISVLDLDRNEVEFVGYNIIPSWGVNNDAFVMVTSRIEGELNKHYFETHQTKVIQYMLECYTNLIVDKPISEAASLAAVSLRKFDNIPLTPLDPTSGETYRSRSTTKFLKK